MSTDDQQNDDCKEDDETLPKNTTYTSLVHINSNEETQ
jgi:hypothetical protein